MHANTLGPPRCTADIRRTAGSAGSIRSTPVCARASGPRTRTTPCANSTPSLGRNGRKSVSVPGPPNVSFLHRGCGEQTAMAWRSSHLPRGGALQSAAQAAQRRRGASCCPLHSLEAPRSFLCVSRLSLRRDPAACARALEASSGHCAARQRRWREPCFSSPASTSLHVRDACMGRHVPTLSLSSLDLSSESNVDGVGQLVSRL